VRRTDLKNGLLELIISSFKYCMFIQFIFIIEIKQAKEEVQTKIYSVCISQLVILNRDL